MKLSVAVAPDNAPQSAFTVFRGVQASIGRAASLGYHGIELAVSAASDVQPRLLESWLSRYGMEVSAISTGLVYASHGVSLLEPQSAIPVFRELIGLASVFGKKVNIGRARGLRRNLSLEQAADALRETLLLLVECADAKGVELLLEPVNRYETDWIHNLDQGVMILERMELENVCLMADVFHMNIEDSKIGGKLVEYARRIHYVHLADSNRLAPGRGHLDFDDVFEALKQIEYDGWASVEILPDPSPEIAAGEAAAFLLPRIAAHNKTLHNRRNAQ